MENDNITEFQSSKGLEPSSKCSFRGDLGSPVCPVPTLPVVICLCCHWVPEGTEFHGVTLVDNSSGTINSVSHRSSATCSVRRGGRVKLPRLVPSQECLTAVLAGSLGTQQRGPQVELSGTLRSSFPASCWFPTPPRPPASWDGILPRLCTTAFLSPPLSGGRGLTRLSPLVVYRDTEPGLSWGDPKGSSPEGERTAVVYGKQRWPEAQRGNSPSLSTWLPAFKND